MITKASFRACPISDRKRFRDSSCIMPISVGQKVHEGEKLSATINLISAYFKACTLLIDDSIQRFTLQIEDPSLTIDEAYAKALRQGDLWLKNNEYIYQRLTIPYDIKRWDDWRSLPEYSDSYKLIEEIYETDASYRQAIHDNIEEFVNRFLPRLNHKKMDRDRVFNNCLIYMKEECAVMCLWVFDKYDFEVYPAGRNQAMSATYEKIIKPNNPDLLRGVALRFKKYGGVGKKDHLGVGIKC